MHCFTYFPNGLRPCPRIFTKLNKKPITTLHFKNVPLSGYLDNFFTKGDTFSICEENIHKTMRLYDKLGFAINFKKSQIAPTQRISSEGKQDLEWWLGNVDNIEKLIALTSIDLEYFCDSSSCSWSANFDTHTCKIGGAWNMKEKALNINCKELLALYYAVRSFTTYFQNKHIKIFSDGQVEEQIINKMVATRSSICNNVAKNIWLFCVKNKIWITAAHIPGAENVIADYESRKSYKDAE